MDDNLLEQIRELSDLETCNDADEMQDRLEKIFELVSSALGTEIFEEDD